MAQIRNCSVQWASAAVGLRNNHLQLKHDRRFRLFVIGSDPHGGQKASRDDCEKLQSFKEKIHSVAEKNQKIPD